MSLSTYSALSTAITAWLNREGMTEVTDQIPTFIELAHRRIFRDDWRAMEEVDYPIIDGQEIYLPDDFLRMKSLTITQGNSSCEVVGSTLPEVLEYSGNGMPRRYTVVGDRLFFRPIPSQSYSAVMVYYRKLPILSTTVSGNWFSNNEPELILWASLMEASLFLKDDQRAQIWEARYKQTRDSILQAEERSGREPGSLRVRVK